MTEDFNIPKQYSISGILLKKSLKESEIYNERFFRILDSRFLIYSYKPHQRIIKGLFDIDLINTIIAFKENKYFKQNYRITKYFYFY